MVCAPLPRLDLKSAKERMNIDQTQNGGRIERPPFALPWLDLLLLLRGLLGCLLRCFLGCHFAYSPYRLNIDAATANLQLTKV
jgi:hypothetical protein